MRRRLRRRLLLLSAPMVIVALLVACKMISVVVAGNAAVSDFGRHDVGALRDDISATSFLNVIAPDNAAFAKGDLAALDGTLSEADSRFGDLLSHTEASRSCPVRVNAELVRETQGDLAVRDGKPDQAEQRYLAALALVRDAPVGCFDQNNDPDPARRAIRNDAAGRLADKIRALHAPPPAPQPVAPPPPPPPPPSAAVGPEINPDKLPGSGPAPELRLDPGAGNPLDRLQEALANSDSAGQPGE
ncbi:hypothetical protein [Mycobacterium sp.]|uniref:hypothetical protein n=1 Tax=Mycobacterium sp. TaxID=1785 RepID=UPI002BD56EE8|nr:hypothetical protein [Mycobacterium sp.]HME49433.1 hypothetical protein [Mycobacterium sp.]